LTVVRLGPRATQCAAANQLTAEQLAKSVAHTLVHALRMQAHRRALVMQEKRNGVSVWALPESPWTLL
jgi:hypothetical protein